MIEKYITDICNILHIEKPSVSYDVSHFLTDTMVAQCSPTSNTIFIKKKVKPDPDYLFSIAHELRHLWQFEIDEEYFLSDYQTIEDIGVEKYNNQLAEIDAHAFASIIMVDFFHLQPLYHGLSDNTISLIKKRIEEIANQIRG